MEWSKLISQSRSASSIYLDESEDHGDNSLISPVQKDVDRVLFSSAFRRLQGKTQVYMFPDTDYVRTRLTHTIEVASIGRALASAIFEEMLGDAEFTNALSNANLGLQHLVEAVAAACYAHDLGNAPFGHIGEYAIRSWFRDRMDGKKIGWSHLKDVKGDQHINDFQYFDGNAQGLRTIMRLQGWRNRGGLQLTDMTIGAFVKYPFGSRAASSENGKFGFFLSEKEDIKRVFRSLGMTRNNEYSYPRYLRHPLSFIMEAADDIAYLASDVEDGVKRRLIPYNEGLDALHGLAKFAPGFNEKRRIAVASKDRYDDYTSYSRQDEVKFLRGSAIAAAVKHCKDAFVQNRAAILDGTFEASDLISCSGATKDYRDKVKNFNKTYVYYENSKVKKEGGGYETIRLLLDMFGEMIEEYFDCQKVTEKMNDRNRNLFSIFTRGNVNLQFIDSYHAYRNIVDYVAGMSDRFAVNLCHELRGRPLG